MLTVVISNLASGSMPATNLPSVALSSMRRMVASAAESRVAMRPSPAMAATTQSLLAHCSPEMPRAWLDFSSATRHCRLLVATMTPSAVHRLSAADPPESAHRHRGAREQPSSGHNSLLCIHASLTSDK